jgi:hypothetical protein
MAELDNLTAIGLANRFAEATIDKIGTEEEDVDKVLAVVNQQEIEQDFERALHSFIDFKDAQELIAEYDTGSENLSLTHAILADEMSGSALARARSMLLFGKEDSSKASGADYFVEGLSNTVDLSSTASKVAVGVAGIAAIGIGAVAVTASSPILVGGATILLGAVIVGSAVAGTVGIVKNVAEAYLAETDAEMKENISELGGSVGTLAMSAPFVPKGASMVKSGIAGIRAGNAANVAVAAEGINSIEPVAVAAAPKNAPKKVMFHRFVPDVAADFTKPQFARGGLVVNGERMAIENITYALKNNSPNVASGNRANPGNTHPLTDVLAAADELGIKFSQNNSGNWLMIVSDEYVAGQNFNPILFPAEEGGYVLLQEFLSNLNQEGSTMTYVCYGSDYNTSWARHLGDFVEISTALSKAKELGIRLLMNSEGKQVAIIDL